MTNKTITLRAHPRGAVTRSDFALQERPEPTPGEGQMVVRPLWLSVDPYMRGRMNGRDAYMPKFELGEPIEGGGVARVVAAGAGAKFREGDLVTGMVPWQERALVGNKSVRAVFPGQPLSTQIGVLGMPGLTAYVGLFDIGNVQPGDTVFVSAAAGAVGSLVGQMAKIHGCRVVGSAGSDDKVRYVKEELGFDDAFNYKAVDTFEALARFCPQGIDVYFDNVGGSTLEAAMLHCNKRARIPVCGMIAHYEETTPSPGPRNMFLLVEREIRMEGFLVTSHVAQMKQYVQQAARWLEEGKLKYRETIVDGFENAPDAFIAMLRGDNVGKMLVRVSES